MRKSILVFILSIAVMLSLLLLSGCRSGNTGDGGGAGVDQGGSGEGSGNTEQGGSGNTGNNGNDNNNEEKSFSVTVNGGAGGGEYAPGEVYTVTAEERSGYIFEKWSNGETSPTFTATAAESGSVTYTAEFTRINTATFEDASVGACGSGNRKYGDVRFSIPSDGTFEIAKDPTDPDNRVLRINKEDSTDSHGYFYIHTPDTVGSKAVWEFSIYIDRSNANGILWQWDFGTTYRIQVQKTSTTIYLTDTNTVAGSNDLLMDMKYDVWYDLRFEFYPLADGKFCFALYLNGEPMAVSDNNYGKIEDCPAYMRIWTMKASSNEYYLDNVSVVRSDSELLSIPEVAPRYTAPDSISIWNNRSVRIERIYGEEVARAFEAMTERLYTDEIYHWLASLYDPKTGGFYYSNSARDSFGYLPDVESTGQTSGLLSSLGVGTFSSILSAEQKARMATWVQQLQSGRDGYLYHPQWETDVNDGRLGRDLGKITSLGTLSGYSILYDHPYARFGDTSPSYQGSSAELTYRLGTTKAVLASRVVLSAVDNSLPAHLQSEEAFRKYLDDLWGNGTTVSNDNYYFGGTITSQNGQIQAAGLSHVAIEVLNKRQEDVQASLRAKGKAPNGIWQENIDYHGISGLLKISGIYNTLGYEMPYAKEALDSAIQMMCASAEEYASEGHTIVSVYNPPSAVRNLLNNINRYGDSKDLEDATALMQKNILDIIATTEEKIALYRKSDGSFSYGIMNSSASSQGEPAAVPGTNEGDVNGTALAIGARTSLMACFDITNVPIMPSYHGAVTYDFGDGKGEVPTSHAEIFRHLLTLTETAQKGAPTTDGVKGIYTFDDGNTPELFDGETFVKLVQDPENTDNKLLCVRDSKSDAGLYVNFNAGSSADSEYYYYRFAADMRFESGAGSLIQLTLARHFMLQFNIKNKALTFVARSPAKTELETYGNISLDPYKWFNLDIRVYPGGIKYGDNIYYAKVIFKQNGVTRVAYYKDFVDSGSIANGMTLATVYSLKSPTPTYYLDNVICCQYGEGNQSYGVYDFDAIDTIPTGVTGGTVIVGADNRLLLSRESADITTAPSYNAKFNFNELRITFSLDECDVGDVGSISLLDRDGANILVIGYTVTDNGILFTHLPSGMELLRADADVKRDMTLCLEYHYDRTVNSKLVPTLYASVRYVSVSDSLYHTKACTVLEMQTSDSTATVADYQSVRFTADSSAVYLNDIFARRTVTVNGPKADEYYIERNTDKYNMPEDPYETIGSYDFSGDTIPDGMNATVAYEISDGKLNIAPTGYGCINFAQESYFAEAVYTTGTRYVFEADFTYAGGKPQTSGSSLAFMGFMTSNKSGSNSVMLYNYVVYGRTLDSDGYATSVNWSGVTFERGVTYRVRFVYTLGGGMSVSVDGKTVAENVSLKSQDGLVLTNFYGFGIEIRAPQHSGSGLSIVLDNISVYTE